MSCHNAPTNPNVVGGEPSLTNKVLNTGASIIQDFTPVQNICAHLHAFHVFASDPKRTPVPTHHYCSHVTSDLRQCLLYDSNAKDARLIGVEYMISPEQFATLDKEEKKLWHSHVFEVKSGMLVMPQPQSSLLPAAAWEAAETKEMEEVIKLYGKVWQLWDTASNDKIPLGHPQLMMSYTKETPTMIRITEERDKLMGVDFRKKANLREYIPAPGIDPDADAWEQDILP
ncbi:DUF1264-domain-containing protein [Ascodesmis nigricans]|uniref:DUF1264-domain-containing protein n=1 Tax=Ascodesmis nigricans TaxID=341454 RepID=A0A4S2MY60_9PEZI|nr:DUF1264-domain-containing protein [Ascodesmis nigricans]